MLNEVRNLSDLPRGHVLGPKDTSLIYQQIIF